MNKWQQKTEDSSAARRNEVPKTSTFATVQKNREITMQRAATRELITWKEKSNRQPLLLRGAKHVGKTDLVLNFAKNLFDQVLHISFTKNPELKSCFHSHNPQEILHLLELSLQQTITPGKTLLFLDDLEECPDALYSLRHFHQHMLKLHLIAAKSEWELPAAQEHNPHPLKGVELLSIRPLSFQEFLLAVAAENTPPTDHAELLKWVRTYLFVGGMPAAVKAYLDTKSLLNVQLVHKEIIQDYEHHLEKQASRIQHKYIRTLVQNTPPLVGQILKYVNLDPKVRSRSLKAALPSLINSGLLHQAFATLATDPSLHSEMLDHRFKLFFLDVGLLQTALRINPEHVFNQDIHKIHGGTLAEQFVAQELLAYAPARQNRPLLYWERGNGGEACVDFVHRIGEETLPIEVKSGAVGSLRALKSFLHLKKAPLGVRISEAPLRQQEQIVSVPFYLISKLAECMGRANVEM